MHRPEFVELKGTAENKGFVEDTQPGEEKERTNVITSWRV